MGDASLPPSEPLSPRLDDRILSTLSELPGRIAFNGLRRALGAHPESLARALRRLEREGLVERGEDGYRALQIEHPPGADVASELRPIARVELPPGVPSEQVFGRLMGHWFGSLRWVGTVERPSGPLLVWSRRDGAGHVLAGISKGVLRVYVPGSEVGHDDPVEAEDAAYELLSHAVAALRPPSASRYGPVSFLRSEARDRPRWIVEN
jgi:DNA-binding transcriptional ArsR family regulator